MLSQEKPLSSDAISSSEHQAFIEKVVFDAVHQLKKEFSDENQKKEDLRTPEAVANHAVRYALSHLSEREAAFDQQSIVTGKQIGRAHV